MLSRQAGIFSPNNIFISSIRFTRLWVVIVKKHTKYEVNSASQSTLRFVKYSMNKNLKKQNNVEIRQNGTILQLLAHLNAGNEHLSNNLYEPLTGFPLTTVAEFSDLDTNENKQKRYKLISLRPLNELLFNVNSTVKTI